MGNGEGGGIKVDKVGGWGGGEVGRFSKTELPIFLLGLFLHW